MRPGPRTIPALGDGRGVGLRPERPEDEAFLTALYASTRVADLALLPLDEEGRRHWLRLQFRCQRAHYAGYAGAAFEIITRDGEPVGRVCTQEVPAAIRLVDIALLPAHRGAGIGGGVVRDVLERAGRLGKAVTAHVAAGNPARRLYERLGFRAELAGEGQPYLALTWSPGVSRAGGGGGG